jgi:hypothetical protein
MPVLFAYLIAVGLLLGGGYGALNWLAAPELIKVVAKAKPKAPAHYEANVAAASPRPSETSNTDQAAIPTDSDKAASTSNGQPSPAGSELPARQEAPDEASSPAKDSDVRAAHAEIPPVEQTPQTRQANEARAVRPVSSVNTPTEAPPSSITRPKPAKRSHVRQASRHPEQPAKKRPLTLMTLRTVQYPDGRRVSQLLPYRGPGHAQGFFGLDD